MTKKKSVNKKKAGTNSKIQNSRNGSSKADTERKSDERTTKNKLKKERRLKEFHGDYSDDDFVKFRRQLDYQGFKLREIQGDGNCLFRALADQLNGDNNVHGRHRKDVVGYMKENKEDFAPFLDETVTFEKYLSNLASNGTYGGNDSIVAFARKNKVDVVIHQFESPAFVINGEDKGCAIKLHLAYHSMEHYSSVRSKEDPGDGPAHMFHRSKLLQKKVESNTNGNSNKLIKNGDEETKAAEDEGNEKDKNSINGNTVETTNKKWSKQNIELIKKVTGFEDELRIEEYLSENNQDVDGTISLILQINDLSLNDPLPHQKDNQEAETENENEEKLNRITKSEDCSSGEHDIKGINPIPQITDSMEEICLEEQINGDRRRDVVEITKLKMKVESNQLKEEEGEEEDCRCGNSEGKDGLGNNTNKKNHNNKQQEEKLHRNHAKHLSNRQRKELAKQERKKRREETKKTPSSSRSGGDESEAPNIPQDISVISI